MSITSRFLAHCNSKGVVSKQSLSVLVMADILSLQSASPFVESKYRGGFLNPKVGTMFGRWPKIDCHANLALLYQYTTDQSALGEQARSTDLAKKDPGPRTMCSELCRVLEVMISLTEGGRTPQRLSSSSRVPNGRHPLDLRGPKLHLY